MVLSLTEFAAKLPGLRPHLHKIVARKGPYSAEDAEDLVEEAICIALKKLGAIVVETSNEGLLLWLRGILIIVILRDRERRARSVKSVPLEAVAELPAPEPTVSPREELLRNIDTLPANQAALVRDWLDGYSQAELAWRNRIHRNTVANRLHLAYQQLAMPTADGDHLTYSASLIDYCSRVTIYHRPVGVRPSWRHTHPPDIRFRTDRRTRCGFSGRRAA